MISSGAIQVWLHKPGAHCSSAHCISGSCCASEVTWCASVLTRIMAAAVQVWSCSKCDKPGKPHHKWCTDADCGHMMRIECHPTGYKGLYTNWRSRHRDECELCSSQMAQQIIEARKQKHQEVFDALTDTSKGHFLPPSLTLLHQTQASFFDCPTTITCCYDV